MRYLKTHYKVVVIMALCMVIGYAAFVWGIGQPVQPVTLQTGWINAGFCATAHDATGLTGAESQYATLLAAYGKDGTTPSSFKITPEKTTSLIRFRGSTTSVAATVEEWQVSSGGDGEYIGTYTLTAPGSGAQESSQGGYYFDQITISAGSNVTISIVNGDNTNRMAYSKKDYEAGTEIYLIVTAVSGGTLYYDQRGYQ